MRRIELRLKAADRRVVESLRWSGLHLAREVNRAHMLAALDRGVADAQICEVLGVERTALWRTRSAYRERGIEYALHDIARPGKPPAYGPKQEAEVTALACSAPLAGARRWTVRQLTQEVRKRPGLDQVSRETVRRLLKKTSSSPGAN
jgi:hypothetical protein